MINSMTSRIFIGTLNSLLDVSLMRLLWILTFTSNNLCLPVCSAHLLISSSFYNNKPCCSANIDSLEASEQLEAAFAKAVRHLFKLSAHNLLGDRSDNKPTGKHAPDSSQALLSCGFAMGKSHTYSRHAALASKHGARSKPYKTV